MNSIKSTFFEILNILIAILLASFGLKGFLLPNGFLDGGVTGISILISELLAIELSYILPIATIPFFILGWFTVSRRILIKSILSVFLLAIVIHFENFQPITEDKLIISIFGGIFLGAGIGLAIKNGAVIDGSEILGIFLNEKFGLSIGKIILLFNIVLFGVTALLLSIEVALYSILAYIVTSKVIDFMIEGFEDYVGLMIVSDKSEELQNNLVNEIGIGLTIYNGSKGFGKRGKKEYGEVIHTVINRIDIRKAYKTIEMTDADAFIIEFDVNQVKGGVLRKYLS
ncbi:YitT family protein [Spongiivirga sp. MCCC 1A20706]|uniref:YitT family protein n=1 Tax=Spongiivirga sp. MCCC 1A20706 TaxID=3160963 RepID=UPI003977737D